MVSEKQLAPRQDKGDKGTDGSVLGQAGAGVHKPAGTARPEMPPVCCRPDHLCTLIYRLLSDSC